MDTNSKVYIAGHTGLIGSALVRKLHEQGYFNLVLKTHAELDLFDQARVKAFYESERPDVVIVAAAKVGGIQANNTKRAEFIYENMTIQNNVIWEAYRAGVSRLVFLGSSCIYPRNAPQPMPESCLLTGELEITNRPYAIAKIAGLELINSLRAQYGCNYFSVMPTNLYGINDNFNYSDAHVLPALLRRMVESKRSNAAEFTVWGTGSALREFLFSDDCADAIIFLMKSKISEFPSTNNSHINIGSGQEIRISDLAYLIAEALEFKGKMLFDTSKPDGTPRKMLDTSFLNKLGWHPKVGIEDGIRRTLNWFLESGGAVRL